MKLHTDDNKVKKTSNILHKIIWGTVMLLLTSCGNNIPTASVVQTAVADKSYLHECKTIYLEKVIKQEQISYMGITPGKTNETELESILGSPSQKLASTTTIDWIYDDTVVFVENGVVKEVIVNYIFLPLEEASAYQLDQLLLDFGCPDIIFAINTTEDMAGYTTTRFIYPKIGMEIDYASFPVNLSVLPRSVHYFRPTGRQEYLEQFGPFLEPSTSKLIDWDEAVR